MHRTFSVPRLFGSLVLALCFQLGAPAVQAQTPNSTQYRTLIELAPGTSRPVQMTTQADLKRVENPNSNVIRVERIENTNNQVMLVAGQPGRCAVTFTDQKGNVEVHEVVVTQPIVQASAVQPAGPTTESQSVTLTKGGVKSVRLREIPTGGVQNENSKVVKVIQPKESPDVATFEGIDFGRSRVTFFAGANKERQEIYDVIVAPEDQALKGVGQVELHVVVAVVNRTMGRNMAFSWNFNGPNWFLSSVIGGPGGLTTVLAPAIAGNTSTLTTAGSANLPFGVLNNNNSFMGFLRATRDEGLTKILAEPRVVAFSSRPGNVISGGHVDIVAAGGVSSAQISADFGTIVNFMPIIGPAVTKDGIIVPAGKIYLEVRPEVSTPTNTIPIPGAGGAGTVSFSVLKRSAQVSVMMEDSQTLAIGGLIQNRVDGTASKVPVLGDMPFFGAAFRSVTYSEQEEEMIILVTPRLIHPVDCTKIPRYLPGRETRSPSDFELFLEGILEAPRGQRNVVFHPRLYKPAFHNSPNAGQIPCIDGNCYGRPGCPTGNCGPQHSTQQTSATVPVPGPTFPELQAIPTTNTRVIPEPEIPATLPPMRDIVPNLGPAIPTSPMPPARQQDTRSVLPPLFPPSGR
jgi:Flp pilus assembly secretin CpaC